MNSLAIVRMKVNKLDSMTLKAWRKAFENELIQFPSFLDKVELPPKDNDGEYLVILRFTTQQGAQQWLESNERLKHLQSDKSLTLSAREEVFYDHDLEWIISVKKNVVNKWKQWPIVFFAVYPLTIIFPFIVNHFLLQLDLHIGFFKGTIITLLISFTMVHKMMPLVFKWFGKWMMK
jgi:uncharacterized protein